MGLTKIEVDAVGRAGAEPMLEQVEAWCAINSGSRNLAGLSRMADVYVDAFSPLGETRLIDGGAADAMAVDGDITSTTKHGASSKVDVSSSGSSSGGQTTITSG